MQKSFDCITKSNKSGEHAFCTVCSVDILVAHGGRQDITTSSYSSLFIYADLHNFSYQVGITACITLLVAAAADKEVHCDYVQIRKIIDDAINIPDEDNDWMREQLRELAVINGTLRDSDTIKYLTDNS